DAAIRPEFAASLTGTDSYRGPVAATDQSDRLAAKYHWMCQQPSDADDVFVEARTHAFRDFALEAERREHVLVEPPQVDAQQNDFRRPRRRKQQAEIARIVQTVQHPARVVKGIRPCPEHRR